jgi:altronate hydrolase
MGEVTARPTVLVLRESDHVATCVDGVAAGTELSLGNGRTVTALTAIPPGHKIAVTSRETGETVHKYGQPIGVATMPIRQGQHVHTHNLASHRAGGPR